MATVRIPTPLRTLTGGEDEVQAAGDTVGDVIENLEKNHPGIRERLLDDKGVRRFVNIYVGEEDIRFFDGPATAAEERGRDQHRPRHRRRLMDPEHPLTRQIRLAEVGTDGQARLSSATLAVTGRDGSLAEFLYLHRAGVERLSLKPNLRRPYLPSCQPFRTRWHRAAWAQAPGARSRRCGVCSV